MYLVFLIHPLPLGNVNIEYFVLSPSHCRTNGHCSPPLIRIIFIFRNHVSMLLSLVMNFPIQATQRVRDTVQRVKQTITSNTALSGTDLEYWHEFWLHHEKEAWDVLHEQERPDPPAASRGFKWELEHGLMAGFWKGFCPNSDCEQARANIGKVYNRDWGEFNVHCK